MDGFIPASKISNLTQGMFVGAVSDNYDERIKQKIFHCEIVVDNARVATETKAYRKIPDIMDFTDENGKDIMQQVIEDNYRQIKEDVAQIIKSELERNKTYRECCTSKLNLEVPPKSRKLTWNLF